MRMMELSAMKDTPDFTNLLTALIHTQIQHLVDQLSEFTDSQTILLSTSPSKLPRLLGSTKGLAFLTQNDIGTRFKEFLKEETRQEDTADVDGLISDDSPNANSPDNVEHNNKSSIPEKNNDPENVSKQKVEEDMAKKCHTQDKIIKNSYSEGKADPIEESYYEPSVFNDNSVSGTINTAIKTLMELKPKWANSNNSHHEDKLPNISSQESDKFIATPISIQSSKSIPEQISGSPCKKTSPVKCSEEVPNDIDKNIESPTLNNIPAETITNKPSPEKLSDKSIDNEKVDKKEVDVDEEDYFIGSAINIDDDSDISSENDDDYTDIELDEDYPNMFITPKQEVVSPTSNKGLNKNNEASASKKSTKAELTCKECGKVFKKEKYVREHMVVHTGEKPFSCSVCNEAFKWESVMRKHRWKCGASVGFKKGKRRRSCHNVSGDQDGAKGNDTVNEPRSKRRRMRSEEDIFTRSNLISPQTRKVLTSLKKIPSPEKQKALIKTTDPSLDTAVKDQTEISKSKSLQNENKQNQKQVTFRQITKYLTPEHQTCKWCKKVLRGLKELKEHENIHTKQFQCYKCDLIIEDREMFRDHLRKCNIVPDFIRKLVPAGTEILMESKGKGQNKVLGTKVKVSKFVFKSSLQNNACKFGNKISKQSTGSEQELPRNIPNKDKQSNDTSQTKYFKCQKCLKSFKYRFLLKKHICKASFSTSIASKLLSNLNKTNLNYKPNTTEITPKASSTSITKSTAKDLWKVKNSYSKQRIPIKDRTCGFCKRVFKTRSEQFRHLAVHTKEKRFKCNFCSKRFGWIEGRVRHEQLYHAFGKSKEKLKNKTKDKSKLKRVNQVQKQILSKVSVKKENVKNKPVKLPENYNSGSWSISSDLSTNEKLELIKQWKSPTCPACGRLYSQYGKSREHYIAFHLQLRPFTCNNCQQTFPRVSGLITHTKRCRGTLHKQKRKSPAKIANKIKDTKQSESKKSSSPVSGINNSNSAGKEHKLNTNNEITLRNLIVDLKNIAYDQEKDLTGCDKGVDKIITKASQNDMIDNNNVEAGNEEDAIDEAPHTSSTILEMETNDDGNSEDASVEREVNDMDDEYETADQGLPDVGTSQKLPRKLGNVTEGLVTQSQPSLNNEIERKWESVYSSDEVPYTCAKCKQMFTITEIGDHMNKCKVESQD